MEPPDAGPIIYVRDWPTAWRREFPLPLSRLGNVRYSTDVPRPWKRLVVADVAAADVPHLAGIRGPLPKVATLFVMNSGYANIRNWRHVLEALHPWPGERRKRAG